MLEQKDSVNRTGYPVAASRTVPNGMKDFSQPVCDMLEKNAHLCSVLNAPLPNSAIRVPTNRLPLANCRPFSPSSVERKMGSSSCRLPTTAQHQSQTFSIGAETYCGIFSRPPVILPGNPPAVRGFCEGSISVHGCCPPVSGMLVSCAETRNGYCMNTACPGMVVRQPVPCRSYVPTMHLSAPPTASSANCDFACNANGVADIANTSAPRKNISSSNLQFSAVVVSAL